MHRTVAIQVKDIVLAPPLAATMQNVVGQLPQPHRRRTPSMPNILRSGWPTRIFRSSRSVEMNWLRIGCILLDEAVQRGFLAHNPAEGTRGFKTGDDESPHRALKREETKALLDAIDRRMSIDKRDYALIMLLLRTGIRRAEAVALTIGDLVMEQGYHAAIIEHGKGNKLSLAKFLVEVRQVIDEYLVAAGREHVVPGAPLFVSFRKGDHPRRGHSIPIRWSALSNSVRKLSGS
jgi:integrase